MSGKAGPRPGGRSARVQLSVHAAAEALLETGNRAEVTIPLIAAKAGVTPSTIYRRWGDLQQLLADLAVRRLQADLEPADTGTGASDLLAWAEQYADEMASGPGREMIRDVLAAPAGSCRCWEFTRQQIEIIAGRARERSEAFPPAELVMDRVVSPILCGILFAQPPDPGRVGRLVRDAMACSLAPPREKAAAGG